MDRHERADFLGFCMQATDRQLENIVASERERASGGEAYYQTCAGIAEAVASERGLYVD